MVFYHDSKPFFGRIHGRPLWDSPGLEDTSNLQPEIIMETGRMVFMNDKSHCTLFSISKEYEPLVLETSSLNKP
jgi:hypothetical protein